MKPVPSDDFAARTLELALDLRSWVAGRSRIDLDTDGLLTDAVKGSLTMIEPAVAELGVVRPDVITTQQRERWIAIDDRITREYYAVTLDEVWAIANDDLDRLIALLQGVVVAR